MKTGNVILAIFLWLMIPVVGVFSGVFGLSYTIFSGDYSGGMLCCFIVPFILFIIGLVVLLMGRENEKQTLNYTVIKESNRMCPNCGRKIPSDARVCPYCEKKFW